MSILRKPFAHFARQRRMRQFLRRMPVWSGMKILDLGGTAELWEFVETPLHVTILNLPGQVQFYQVPRQHTIEFVEGDACCASDYADGAFDLVFSNSVIEHVGPPDRQSAFAGEARRLGRSYWIQTPSIWFPIEAHCGMPFWWFYPESLRRWFLKRWHQSKPTWWTEMVEGTRVLKRPFFASLFPESKQYVERFALITKSYVRYHSESEVESE